MADNAETKGFARLGLGDHHRILHLAGPPGQATEIPARALTALGNDQAHVAEVAVTGCGAMCSPTQLRDLKAKICDAWASW